MERQRHARRADVQRAPQTRAQQQQQQRAAQRRVQPARQAPPRRVGGVSSALGEGVTVVDSGPVHHMDIGESLVHRHVTDAPVPKVKLPGMGHLHLNAHTLRQAIVLKEILDPPVSMRQPVV